MASGRATVQGARCVLDPVQSQLSHKDYMDFFLQDQACFQRIGPVRMSVCVFVRHTFSLRLTVFLQPLPEVQCPDFLDFRNSLGKIMERSGLRFENFCS